MSTEEQTMRASASLAGQVRGAGRPLSDAAVTLTDAAGTQAARAVTGEDGRFHIGRLVPGAYVAIVSRPGFRPNAESVRVPESGVAEFLLEPATTLRGTVRDSTTGEPVALATVTALGPGGEVLASATSDLDGSFRLSGLDTISVTLVAAGSDVEPAALPVHLTDGECTVDLTVGRRGEVHGIVSRDGHPVAGLTLVLRDADGREVATSRTGADGSYRFENLAPGEYAVSSLVNEPRVAEVPADATHADISFARG